ncbi:hypothetical protein EGI16_02335 [Chryseobacterium sp. G0240]|uniref:hypothetical protein n=1 Tax=Chryseobacterium sp. G0240 TaxID=2487066 RepID=UPI000F447266|nr:hypothetical protein [Chryseobacterium sp. G0240]ROI06764.1 hypothetical protein EGI16_02335 [Chryseobacterium sp. G0240]
MNYAVKRNIWVNEDPAVIFQFHQSMRSLIRAVYLMMLKERKWIVDNQPKKISSWVIGLLSEKEYRNPLLVFKKAFREYTLKELIILCPESSISQWGVYENLPERNIVMPYIHTVKMLDATHYHSKKERKEEG